MKINKLGSKKTYMKETKSKNLGRVALQTLVFLLVLTVLLTTIFLVAFPRQSSDILTKLGIDGLASNYAKITYERSKDFNDLAMTFSKSVTAENHEQVKKYGQILVENANYEDYVDFQEKNSTILDYDKWVKGNMAVASLHIDGVSKAISDLNLTTKTSYVEKSPLEYVVIDLISTKTKLDADEIKLINDKLDMVFQGMESRNENVIPMIIVAYTFANEFCESEIVSIWQTRYEQVN